MPKRFKKSKRSYLQFSIEITRECEYRCISTFCTYHRWSVDRTGAVKKRETWPRGRAVTLKAVYWYPCVSILAYFWSVVGLSASYSLVLIVGLFVLSLLYEYPWIENKIVCAPTFYRVRFFSTHIHHHHYRLIHPQTKIVIVLALTRGICLLWECNMKLQGSWIHFC